MNNCLIMGSGRSGTSMLAGILHQAGYYLGDRLYPPRDSNPKGFFENRIINGINEEILAPYSVGGLRKLHARFSGKRNRKIPGKGQFWLMSLPPQKEVVSTTPSILKKIEEAVSRKPFGYKDPRFCYTLPVWDPFLPPDTVILCIFRQPNITAASILKECRSVPYLNNFSIKFSEALELWRNMYSHVLKYCRGTKRPFCFLHYDQIYKGTALEELSERLNAPLSGDFVDAGLKRSRSEADIPESVEQIYREICKLAGC